MSQNYAKTTVHDISQNGQKTAQSLPKNAQGSILEWFLPREETNVMAEQSRGLFIPYPLLGLILTLVILVVGGIVAMQVQLSNLNTTLLLRESDYKASQEDIKRELTALKEKDAQLEVYIHSDREKLIGLESKLSIKRQ